MNVKQNHKRWRKQFNESALKRDGNKCRVCGKGHGHCVVLDVHHITDRKEMPNGGYVLSNAITLCEEHHLMAEHYHISGKTKWVKWFHPDDLYRMIGSSYALAKKESENLS